MMSGNAGVAASEKPSCNLFLQSVTNYEPGVQACRARWFPDLAEARKASTAIVPVGWTG